MSEKYRPSNGTEGEYFMAEFCYRCKHDNPGAEDYCDILTASLLFDIEDKEYPKEWIYDKNDNPKCTAFERE